MVTKWHEFNIDGRVLAFSWDGYRVESFNGSAAFVEEAGDDARRSMKRSFDGYDPELLARDLKALAIAICVAVGASPEYRAVVVATIDADTRYDSKVVPRGPTAEEAATIEKLLPVIAALANNNERLIRQWYRCEFLEDAEGALWTRAMVTVAERAPDLRRIVVALDPSVAADGGGDECGLIIAGVDFEGRLWVLRDGSGSMSPAAWAARAVALYGDERADAIVAEANNGGALVETTLRAAGAKGRVNLVHAARGKRARAEPVSALYEQGRAFHLPGLTRLEDELCTWSASTGDPSPNRLDALVWAAFELCDLAEPARDMTEESYHL